MYKDLFSNNGLDSPIIKYVKALLVVLGTIGIFFVGQIVGIVLLVIPLNLMGFNGVVLEDMFENNTVVQFLSILAIEAVTVGLFYLLYRFRNKNLFKSVALNKIPKLSNFGMAIVAYGLYFVAFLVVVIFVSELIPSVNVDQEQQLGFKNTVGIDKLLVFVSLVILPAIAEEIVFRGVLFQKLKQLISLKPAVLLTSVVFGLAHLEFFSNGPLNWVAAIDTFIFSIFLIGLVIQTKSLWSSIFLHAIKNTIAFVVLFII